MSAQSEKLTAEDLEVLRGFFAVDEHEFDYGKNCYIKELSVSERLEQVDPAFSFVIKNIEVRPSAGENGKEVGTVTVHASMTVKGSTRESTGMAVILKSDEKEETKWNNDTRKKEKTGVMYTVEANQAEKSATTDALKRCARLFGIGRYMLQFGNDVNDTASLKRWLDKHAPIDMNQWNETTMRAFWQEWTGKGYDQEFILKTLNVSKLSEWTSDYAIANKRMNNAINKASGQ